MKLKITDKDWYIKNPRWSTIMSSLLMILMTTSCGIIAEWSLQIFFDDLKGLGVWAIVAVVGSLLVAIVRLHTIATAIGIREWSVTVHDKKGRGKTKKIKQLTSLEKAIGSIEESFKSVTELISVGIIAAVSILITQQYPNLEEQLPTWIKSYPISIAALASSTSIVMTNAKTVERLLGQGRILDWAIRVAQNVIIVDAGITILVVLAGIIVLFIRIL